jgi:hypothetical protein
MDSKVHDVMLEQARAGDATAAIALGIFEVAAQLKALGMGEGSQMGALEAVAAATKEGLWDVASALREDREREPEQIDILLPDEAH